MKNHIFIIFNVLWAVLVDILLTHPRLWPTLGQQPVFLPVKEQKIFAYENVWTNAEIQIHQKTLQQLLNSLLWIVSISIYIYFYILMEIELCLIAYIDRFSLHV